MSLREKEMKISTFRHGLLCRLLQEADADNVESYVQKIIAHVKEVTEAQHKSMKRTGVKPNKRHKYPGFLGHGTCVAFRVGGDSQEASGSTATAVPVTTEANTGAPPVGTTTTTTTTTTPTENATTADTTVGELVKSDETTHTATPERPEGEKGKIHLSLASGRAKTNSLPPPIETGITKGSKSPRRRGGTVDTQ